MSNREKKKLVQQGVARLKQKPGWDPAKFTPSDPREKLRELDQESRNDAAYGESNVCASCASARAESGDETALCQAHLEAAMGF